MGSTKQVKYVAKASVSAARPIILMVFMGSGKTTIGRALAKRLGLKFYDLARDRGRDLHHPESQVKKLWKKRQNAYKSISSFHVRILAGENNSKTAARVIERLKARC